MFTSLNIKLNLPLEEKNSTGIILSLFSCLDEFFSTGSPKALNFFWRERLSSKERRILGDCIREALRILEKEKKFIKEEFIITPKDDLSIVKRRMNKYTFLDRSILKGLEFSAPALEPRQVVLQATTNSLGKVVSQTSQTESENPLPIHYIGREKRHRRGVTNVSSPAVTAKSESITKKE